MSRPSAGILRIIAIYALVSGLWIFFSDRLVNLLFSDPQWRTTAQTYKGWAFVLATSIILFILIRREKLGRELIEDALLTSQRSSQRLFSTNPIAMWVVDQETLSFVSVNNAALKLYGYSRDEFLRMHLMDLIEQDSLETGSEGEASPLGNLHRSANGRPIRVEAISHPIDFIGRPALLVAVDDVSHQREIEDAFQTSEQMRLVAEESLHESQLHLKTTLENLPVDVWIQDPSGRFILQNEASRQKWGNLTGQTLTEAGIEHEIIHDWNKTNERVLQGEIVREEGVFPGREKLGTFYKITAPIRDDGQIRGILGIDLDISALKERENELQTVVSIASAVRSASDQEEMISCILDQIMDHLNLVGASVVMESPDRHELEVRMGRGVWADFAGTDINAETGITRRVMTTGELYLDNDLPNSHPEEQSQRLVELTSCACIPLKAENEINGVLWVGSRSRISDRTINVLITIADIAGNAIHRALLYEQTERQLQRLTALRAIELAITASLDVRLTLNILLSQVISLLNVDAADVLLYSPKTEMLEHAASRGFESEEVQYTHLRLGESHAGQAALQRQMEYIPDLSEYEDDLTRALLRSGETFTSYLCIPLVAKGQAKGVIEILQRSHLNPTPDWLEFLQTLAAQAAIAIDNAELFENLQRSNEDLTQAYDATIEGWSRALELRDRETEGHTRRVTEMTMRLANWMGISDGQLVNIRRGVLLHDIGKMAIPDRILQKPGPLADDEWRIMRRHPQYAHEMLSSIPYLQSSIDIPYSHHERWDGKGYPRGLKHEEIPLPARIFAVVDIWDALTSDRPYRVAWAPEKVLHYIQDQAGKRLDPQVVEVFVQNMRKSL